MKLKLILFLLLITQIALSQKKNTDLKEMNLKGEVMSITTIEDKMPSVTDGSGFYSQKETNLYIFNKYGFITEQKYIKNNKFDSKKKKYYNSSNQIVKIESYNSDDKFDVNENFAYEYEINGETSKMIYLSLITKYRNELIKKGITKSFLQYSFNSENIEEKNFERIENEKGKVIEENYYIQNELYSKTLKSHNSKGLLSKKSYFQYWNGNETMNINEYLHNSKNDIIKITTFDSQNNIVDVENITYVYDKKNNWIKKNSQGSETITIIERKIEYKK